MKWAIKHKSGRVLFVTSDEFIADNRRKMGWIVEIIMSKCPKCNNTGMVDSGGVQPWGEPILIKCDCWLEKVMMTSREQFEAWAKENGMSLIYGDCDYVYSTTVWAWKAWQASREAIEVELPVWDECDATWQYQEAAMDKIELAGLKVKK